MECRIFFWRMLGLKQLRQDDDNGSVSQLRSGKYALFSLIGSSEAVYK